MLKGLLVDCSRVSSWVAESPVLSWKDFFFGLKGVDCRGDEVLKAASKYSASIYSGYLQVGTRFLAFNRALPAKLCGAKLIPVVPFNP